MIKLSIKNEKFTNSGLLTPKNTLNPKIWTDMEIDPETQEQLKAIAEDIIKNMEINAECGVEKCHEFMENAKSTLDTAVYGLNDAKMQIMQNIIL